MEDFKLDKDDGAVNKGEKESSGPSSHLHVQHRRSKSASERNSDVSRDGVLRSTRTNIRTPIPSPFNDYPNRIHKNASSSHRASLEKDIEHLQSRLQQEKSMRLMLEKAMGRISSTLSPGHRHFASQTKEIIAEIELLEEEVANREQHVLSLYRSIFEHCVSRPPSEHNSRVASPAHTKHASKKQPSIISSAFCSSKNFPLRLVSFSDSSKRNSKSDNALFSGKGDFHFEKTSSMRGKTPDKEKAFMLRTLKDHLYQCPSKLSEEMVRSMAGVYCWLSSTTSSATPLLSKSSTNVIMGENRDWSCKSMVEISHISTHQNQFSRASYAINTYRVLVKQLEKLAVSQMENNAQIAFWINVHNALIMHAYLAYGIPNSSFRRLSLFHKAAYNVGGHIISANAIEESIFGLRTPRVGRWLESILSSALRKKSGEERQLIRSKFGLSVAEPLVCFALCSGAFSDPVLRVYSASSIQEQLEAAKREFLQANVVVKKSRKVFLPRVLERFLKEASVSSDDILKWLMRNVDKKLHDSMQKCIEIKSNKRVWQMIEWIPYSSRFRYVFSKDLTERPWWA
ncbi:hypothetical protein K2173_011127 [Erythroxylum novogranatense]|uniref:Electron transporter n=1 Tax=Erythroxylum novogranatense TaxID=1862640 RepID=A0AAV8SR13_9ROSI|nr:hypothetical protein K2173_011127 [Erythroxylum novogranatense]